MTTTQHIPPFRISSPPDPADDAACDKLRERLRDYYASGMWCESFDWRGRPISMFVQRGDV